MKNSIGTSIQLTLFGESHGPAIGAVIDGLAPGIPVDEDFIASQLSKRRPGGMTDTARIEADRYSILSGVYKGFTTGAPLAIVIPNENVRSADYASVEGIARPSHADYAANCKYHGFEDPRGGGHFSGRITAAIVAAGAVCIKALEAKGIKIATHILECGGVKDAPFSDFAEEMDLVNSRSFPVIADVELAMTERISAARAEGDSLGGVIQTAVTGLPAGVGEPWFDSLESVISRAVFAIGGIKGGISNGMPLVFNMAVKPTPSIAKTQKSVNFKDMTNVDLEIKGRHDPAIVRRICVVVSSLLAVVLSDALALRFGTDYLAEDR